MKITPMMIGYHDDTRYAYVPLYHNIPNLPHMLNENMK